MNNPGQVFSAAAVLVATAGLGACGWGVIDFGGGGHHSGSVNVAGNIDQMLPLTTRDVVVFVFSGQDSDGNCGSASTTTSTLVDTSCTCPAAPVQPDCTPGKAVMLAAGEKTFQIDGVDSGKIRVVFLLDNSGNDADGQIDPGDPIAVLDDIDCELDDVSEKMTVTLTDVDIQFDAAPVSECKDGVNDPPAAGRARAFSITKAQTTSGN